MGLSIEEQRNKIREREKLKVKPQPKKTFKSKKPKNKNKVKKQSLKAQRKYFQKRGANFRNELILKATKHELILKEALIELGIMFSFQKLVYDHERTFILDFYLNTYSGRYAIELDGYHHFTDKGRAYDKKRSEWLFKRRKIKTVRFSNSEIENDLNKCITAILLLSPKKIVTTNC
jgi:very-short-patch-repair endonuclease